MDQTINFVTSPVFTTVMPAALNIAGLLGGLLAQAGLFYLAVTLLGGHTRFGVLWGIAVWSALPFAARTLLQTIFIAFSGKTIANPGLSGLVKTSTDPLATLQLPVGQQALSTALAQIDLFVIWNLVLLIIGVAIAARFSQRKAALIVISFWALSVALQVLLAIGSAMLTSGQLM